MKRSQYISLNKMRKEGPKHPAFRPLTLAIAAITLTACSQPDEEVKVVSSVEDCTANTTLSLQQCQVAYQKAIEESVRTGPRYGSERQCEEDFGYDQCIRPQSSGFFMPMLTGFMIGNMLNNRAYTYNPVYQYRNSGSSYRNRLMTADGSIIGTPGKRSYSVPPSALKPKPKVTRTVSRGGFGAVASAKSNWGGGKSKGWGG
ncbi:DUF1190 domain-containing protein [Marinomonas mediterranea]|uniref:DUF1190 domain-containing protein n=1 Tax=Marinomonas mediterranea TaxID=119864 RepID=UPI00234A90A8|nr:DUF1190 domain-containing protein [Marinomonas mediterranea]WCN10430.1 DUF1190 domain-containing protein [Marinomonas mediterranea]WCN14478.1 DUF1190 domain-containing protein [Marinomonas mediterranea]